jgi:hypothetical protein
MAFCAKHQHAFVNVCSECVVERLKASISTVKKPVQHSVFDVEQEEEANDDSFSLAP